jgi:hypothetical protein
MTAAKIIYQLEKIFSAEQQKCLRYTFAIPN